jgi:mitochondrial import inner membrane translocase subunit TIM23
MLATRVPFNSGCNALKRSKIVRSSAFCIQFQRQYLCTFRQKPAISTLRPNILPLARSIRIQVRTQSAAAASPAQPSSTNTSQQPLTWNRFLQLRKVRRRLSLIASIACAVGALVGGVSYISSTPDIESKISPAIGLDPFITMGLMTFACGAAGWLVGPFIGGALFSLRYRSMTRLIAEVRLWLII